MKPAPVKGNITVEDFEKIDIGFADKILPCLAVPEVPVPNGTRAG